MSFERLVFHQEQVNLKALQATELQWRATELQFLALQIFFLN